jgi:hypothetical protein
MVSRLLAISLLLGVMVPGLSGCSSIGPVVGDALPEWAGGLPKDVPPRPGTPEYDEYRRRLTEPKAAPPASQEQGQAAPAAATPPPRITGTR